MFPKSQQTEVTCPNALSQLARRAGGQGGGKDGQENRKLEEPQLTFTATHNSAFRDKYIHALHLVYYLKGKVI